MRLSWVQPEDVVAHALVAARLDGADVEGIATRWRAAGGSEAPVMTGASRVAATGELRRLARQLLDKLDELPIDAEIAAAEPEDVDVILGAAPGPPTVRQPGSDLGDRVHGAWLGRAVGCLLGKPVEKVGRRGIRAIAESTGNWPITGYFSEVGLDPEVSAAHPWNRRSRATSLRENIAGMPVDDDLEFALVALSLVERHGARLTTDDVATAWLELLPGGRVFTAERLTYRNLLDGDEPALAGRRGNPFQDWIGAQIRADVYGWVAPGRPAAAGRLAWQDARLSHHRNGVYGAMFVAAATATAAAGGSVDDCVEAGLAVVPSRSRYAAAIRRGVELARSASSDEDAIDVLYDELGHLHWVHVLNNSALLAFAVVRSGGELEAAITTVVAGGWDTDSNGATAGSICGAIAGAAALPAEWTDPLDNRLASSIPGFDGIGFDELARRTVAASVA